MRIIGDIAHPVLKITVFKDNGKISVKFESGLFEQTYKLREMDELAGFAEVEKLVDETFKNDVLEEFQRLNQIRNRAMKRFLPPAKENDFEVII